MHPSGQAITMHTKKTIPEAGSADPEDTPSRDWLVMIAGAIVCYAIYGYLNSKSSYTPYTTPAPTYHTPTYNPTPFTYAPPYYEPSPATSPAPYAPPAYQYDPSNSG